MALIAPELVVLCAMKQWVVARRFREQYKGRRWTTTHGFFVQMGGLVLVNSQGKPPGGDSRQK
ncbi:hypothetical protein JAAARDRAFT_40956 [Jaapia argillacea MUCL 33604]|uniref:Uncharacterized protein n=1 Tax=Jaapia argillacea MUCL 33604 TaxID=933084 RepID=A0A067PCZ3_9AGAM|nr:hypothetical protein JAAARDRAFT_40956 [Jaapia argillacea MUCL 33604]